MHTSAVSGNTFSKVVFGLTAVLLLFAPLTAQAAGPDQVFDFQQCNGYFALCAASTCTPTGNKIAVNTATGSTKNFPEAELHVSGHSRSVPCQLDRGQYARFLRAARTRPNLVELSDQTEHSAGAHQLGSDPARGRNKGAGLSGEPQPRRSVCTML